MIRRPPRSTLFPYTDALPIWFDGRLIGSDTFSITGTGAVIPADASNLAISEIHYHPIAPDAIEIAAGFTDPSMFEWIELLNLSETSTLDLANLAFDDGIELVIPAGTALAPGERLVVPANASEIGSAPSTEIVRFSVVAVSS